MRPNANARAAAIGAFRCRRYPRRLSLSAITYHYRPSYPEAEIDYPPHHR